MRNFLVTDPKIYLILVILLYGKIVWSLEEKIFNQADSLEWPKNFTRQPKQSKGEISRTSAFFWSFPNKFNHSDLEKINLQKSVMLEDNLTKLSSQKNLDANMMLSVINNYNNFVNLQAPDAEFDCSIALNPIQCGREAELAAQEKPKIQTPEQQNKNIQMQKLMESVLKNAQPNIDIQTPDSRIALKTTDQKLENYQLIEYISDINLEYFEHIQQVIQKSDFYGYKSSVKKSKTRVILSMNNFNWGRLHAIGLPPMPPFSYDDAPDVADLGSSDEKNDSETLKIKETKSEATTSTTREVFEHPSTAYACQTPLAVSEFKNASYLLPIDAIRSKLAETSIAIESCLADDDKGNLRSPIVVEFGINPDQDRNPLCVYFNMEYKTCL